MRNFYPTTTIGSKVLLKVKVVFLLLFILLTKFANGQTDAAEINVKQGNTDQLTGSTYSFENQNIKTKSADVEFTIENLGTTDLNISNITLTGADAEQFVLTTTSVVSEIPAGGSTNFKISFSPTNNEPEIKNALITLLSDDADENSYTIEIVGRAEIVPATITSFSPTSATEGASITIIGTNLINTTAVAFNDLQSAKITIENDNQIKAVVPDGATSGPIGVINSAGKVSSTEIFKVIPTITEISPTEGAVGIAVVITGTGLSDVSSVMFNGIEASFIIDNNTQITATVPMGATIGKITVTSPGGAETSPQTFYPPPTITSIDKPDGTTPIIIGDLIEINGTNFTSGASVTFTDESGASITATKTFVSATRLTAIIPVGAVSGQITVNAIGGEDNFTITIENTTYTWNNTSSSWSNPSSWTPARTNPTINDLLLFDGNITVNPNLDFDSDEETIGYLSVINSANVSFIVATDKTLTIDNNIAAGADFIVAKGSSLTFSNSAEGADLTINITSGETGTVMGTVIFQAGTTTNEASHQLLASTSLNFSNGGKFIATNNVSDFPFGSTNLNSVIFLNGSSYINQSVISPFGIASPNSVVVFRPGSNYNHEINSAPDLIGRTYGNFIVNDPNFNQAVTGNGNLIIRNSLVINKAENFDLNLIGAITIGQNIEALEGTLNFDPSGATTIKLDGSGGVTNIGAISGEIAPTSTINIGDNSNLVIAKDAIITINKSIIGTGKITVDGTVRTSLPNGLIGSGAAFELPQQSITLHPESTVDYAGNEAQTISAINYSNLSISNDRASNVITLPNTLQISGAFSPTATNAIYNPAANTIEFNGGNQIIPAFNFHNVIISGTDDKVLGETVTINGTLKMVANKIETNGNNLILASTATITGESPGSYVVGNLSTSRILTASAGSDFGGIGITIGLGTRGPQNLEPTVVNRVSGPGSSIVVEESEGIFREGINRKWTVLPATQPTSPIDVTLTWVRDDDNGKDLTTARVWKTQGNDEFTFYDVSKVEQDASNRTISVAVSSFSTLTVSDRNNPLPVELISFDVAKKGQNAVITWQTATEKNSLGFGIEISTDAKNFKEVGFVKSLNPNSNTLQNYEFTHRAALSGTVYYRLKQTDWNNVSHYFGPKAIYFDKAATVAVFPNPVSDTDGEVTVQAGGMAQEEVNIIVTDALGKVVYKQTEPKNLTRNELKVNVKHLRVGVYVLTVTSPTNSFQTKIVKH